MCVVVEILPLIVCFAHELVLSSKNQQQLGKNLFLNLYLLCRGESP